MRSDVKTESEAPLREVSLLMAFPSSSPEIQDPLFETLRSHGGNAGITVRGIAITSEKPEALAEASIRKVLRAERRDDPIAIGGFSLGARMAAAIASSVEPASVPFALVCFGYPFHVLGAPEKRHGLAVLQKLRTPTLIVQGSRDSHGNRQQVRGYDSLPPCVEMHWLADANHRFRPRHGVDQSEQQHIQTAATVAIAFVRRVLRSGAHG